jgi:hypothetical protein
MTKPAKLTTKRKFHVKVRDLKPKRSPKGGIIVVCGKTGQV